jgi:hypothetical protein
MDRYIRFVLKRPVWVLIIFSIITIILASGMLHLQFDTSITAFLPTTDIEYENYERVKEIYGDSDTFVILDITDKNLWQYETFERINNLIIDLEEFENYDAAREQVRITAIDQLLEDPGITSAALLKHFADDPAFKRLLARKLKIITEDTGPLSSRKKKKLKSAVMTAQELKSAEMIDDIISPLTAKDITGEDDTLETIELIETDADGNRLLPRTDEEFQALIEKLRRNPVFERGIYVSDDKGTITDLGIIIRFKDGSNSDPIAREILEIVYSHDDKLNILPQGQPMIYIWINNYMEQDLARLIPLVMLVVVIIFFINFKSIRGVILPFATLSMASLWILGLMGHLGAKITTVGTSIPVLMIAVGSSYAIHILNQYYADYNLITREGKTIGLQHAMGHISMTVLLTGLTTFVAFMTLATHQISAISEWGFFSALGIMFAVLISASIIPAALQLMPHKPGGARFRKRKGVNSPMIDRIIHLASIGSIHHYKKVLAVVFVVLVVSFIGLLKIQVDTELLRNFKKENYIRTSAKTISEKYGGRWGFNIVIDSGKPDGVKCTEYLNTVSDFRAWLESDENKDLCIGRTDAFPDYLKTMNMAMNNDDPAFFSNPACNMDITDYLEIYSDDDDNSDGRIDQFEPYVDTQFSACNVLARLGEDGDTLLGTFGMEKIFKKISEHLDQTLPDGYSYKITGHPSLMVQSSGYIVDGQINSLLLTLVVIGIMILFLLKDFKAGLLSLIPMSVAVIFNFGIMGWFGIYLDVATSTIATITIGIGVDDTIHFLNTFRYYRNLGEDINTAIQHTLEVAGKAILFTSMALIFGFSVMGLSTFKPLILFGILMMVTMVATTIGALLVLPCAIKLTNVSLVKT